MKHEIFDGNAVQKGIEHLQFWHVITKALWNPTNPFLVVGLLEGLVFAQRGLVRFVFLSVAENVLVFAGWFVHHATDIIRVSVSLELHVGGIFEVNGSVFLNADGWREVLETQEGGRHLGNNIAILHQTKDLRGISQSLQTGVHNGFHGRGATTGRTGRDTNKGMGECQPVKFEQKVASRQCRHTSTK